MVKIFCPQCGEPHESEGKFCKNCGNNLEGTILRYKQKHLPIKYQGATLPENENQRKAKKSGGSTVALVFGILTLLSGGAEIAIVAMADWSQTIYITLSIIFGLIFLISFVTVSVLTGCCSGSGCSGCDCGGCDCGGCEDVASGCGDCASGCDCGGCDISC
ncbi:MAG: hypothetical protein ACTSQF_14600 [Candidatus Heimdallarchaeaceae archaeon]